MRSLSFTALSFALSLALAALPPAAALPRAPADAAVPVEPRADARADAPAANLTFLPPLENRAIAGQATHYSPAREGPSPIGSCGGKAMNDNTMGVALSQAGWDRFARHGLTQADLCWKELTIFGPNGKTQTAQLMDTCPYDEPTQTCGSVCDLDLTTGLFAKLEDPKIGIFPIKWSFNDGTPSGCGPLTSGGVGGKNGSSAPSSTAKHHASAPSSSPAVQNPAPAAATASAAPAPKPAASNDPVMAMLSALFGGLLGGAQPASSSATPTPTQNKVYTPSANEKGNVDSVEDMLQAIIQAIIH